MRAACTRKIDGLPTDRPVVVDTTDVYVDKNGLIYTTDMNAGLYIMEMENL